MRTCTRSARGRLDMANRDIHEDERLERRLSTLPNEGANFAIRRVKRREGWIVRGAAPEDIHAAAVEFVAVVLYVFDVDAVPDAGGLVGADAGAADFVVEEAGDGEGVVTNEFGVEAKAGAAREEAVVGIAFEFFGERDRRRRSG